MVSVRSLVGGLGQLADRWFGPAMLGKQFDWIKDTLSMGCLNGRSVLSRYVYTSLEGPTEFTSKR